MYQLLKKISLEGKILLLISFLDCANTALATAFGTWIEFNPVMDILLKQGIWIFVAVKVAIALVLISALEIIRYKLPDKVRFIRRCQWVAIIGYLVLIILPFLLYR